MRPNSATVRLTNVLDPRAPRHKSHGDQQGKLAHRNSRPFDGGHLLDCRLKPGDDGVVAVGHRSASGFLAVWSAGHARGRTRTARAIRGLITRGALCSRNRRGPEPHPRSLPGARGPQRLRHPDLICVPLHDVRTEALARQPAGLRVAFCRCGMAKAACVPRPPLVACGSIVAFSDCAMVVTVGPTVEVPPESDHGNRPSSRHLERAGCALGVPAGRPVVVDKQNGSAVELPVYVIPVGARIA